MFLLDAIHQFQRLQEWEDTLYGKSKIEGSIILRHSVKVRGRCRGCLMRGETSATITLSDVLRIVTRDALSY